MSRSTRHLMSRHERADVDRFRLECFGGTIAADDTQHHYCYRWKMETAPASAGAVPTSFTADEQTIIQCTD